MPTINDIAKEAGVSHGTVSNVLNKTGKVSIEKIQLVENAIKKLGYVPNVQAQRLRQGSPNTIAVILPSLKEAKYIDFFTALQLNFPKSQKSLLVYQTEDIPAEEEVILDNLRASGLAALIVISTLSKECLEKYRSLHCPIVFVERRPRTLRTDEWFLSFDPQKIGDVVGQRGKTINAIIEQTGVKIDITDDGSVSICGTDKAMMDKAKELINIIVSEFEEGQVYVGKVVSIKEFGAFLEFAPGKEGMVHISKIAKERINHVEDVLTLGDVVKVVCLGKDKMGRISFSIKDVKED